MTSVETIDHTHEFVTISATTNITVTINDISNVDITLDITLTMILVITASNDTSLHPCSPKRLTEVKNIPKYKSNFLNELKNLHVFIPLLQGIWHVPIYSKVIRELSIINLSGKPLDPFIVHVIGKL